MAKRLSLSGKQFGNLTVLDFVGFDRFNSSMWRCKCKCGVFKIIRGASLIGGKSKSCGCIAAAINSKRMTKHGQSRTSLYRVWRCMRDRCYREKHSEYKNYGGRGVKVCKRWNESFENFKDDMEKTYFDGAELDRKNNNGNYEPSNCRWITHHDQQSNKRTNQLITHKGLTLTASQWAKKLGIKPNTILTRIKRKWPTEKLLEIPK